VRAGIAIGRKELSLAVMGRKGGAPAVVFARRIARSAGGAWAESGAAEAAGLLRDLPAHVTPTEIAVAFSPGELACADCFFTPYRAAPQLEAVIGSLAEERACGESADELALDFQQVAVTKAGSLIELVAVRQDVLKALCAELGRVSAAPVVLVTAIPVALAHACALTDGPHVFELESAGESILLHMAKGQPQDWRCLPIDTPGRDATPPVLTHAGQAALALLDGGIAVELALLPAAAAAALDPRRALNLLRGAAGAPKSVAARLRRPLLQAAGAAALLFLAGGVCFSRKADALAQTLARCEQLEQRLGETCLPGGRRAGTQPLISRMKRALVEHNRTRDINPAFSALSFWSEIATHMPVPDRIGLALESLQLGPDSGRLVAKVDTTPNDPLANAALLERTLNSSPALTARGEYEAKSTEVVVRMRLDYKPPATPVAERAAP
jgi:hypothetical protein